MLMLTLISYTLVSRHKQSSLVMLLFIHNRISFPGCKTGYYKESIGNGQCIACPSNSVANPNHDSCPCQNGFYRAPKDAINDSCTGKALLIVSYCNYCAELIERKLNSCSQRGIIQTDSNSVTQIKRQREYKRNFIIKLIEY